MSKNINNMTTISVKFASISPEEYERIIDHYNIIKPNHYLVLERLDRCEGGFQIALNEYELTLIETSLYCTNDRNYKIKQLRWNRRRLDPYIFIGFNHEETMLLYQSLIHVFGGSDVVLD